ncbi:MAG: CDP-alcohol phosphatidyltransferase family protein [Alphaproteobacteria bacterium]|nr:CDP-alcohol phosphatidyltransferase family protein [Alphaproteobacteria bacterium]
MRDLPNALTLLRLLTVPLTMWLMVEGRMTPAFWLFVAAGVTDALDGFLARVLDARTQLGRYLDPLADKALLIGIYLMLAVTGHLPWWLVALVMARDGMILAGAWFVYTRFGAAAVKPLFISKVNTAAQIVLAALVLAALGLGLDLGRLIPLAFWTVVATTLASGVSYVVLISRRLQPASDRIDRR